MVKVWYSTVVVVGGGWCYWLKSQQDGDYRANTTFGSQLAFLVEKCFPRLVD